MPANKDKVDEMKTINQCIEEGIEARSKGINISNCPYSLKSLRSRDRRAGWHKGFMKAPEKIPESFLKYSKQVSMPWSKSWA